MELDMKKVTEPLEITMQVPGLYVSIPCGLKDYINTEGKESFCVMENELIVPHIIQVKGMNEKKSLKDSSYQRTVLQTYSNNEIKYIQQTLGIELINPSNQWVKSKGRDWYIWYFKIASPSKSPGNETMIQLYASTIIGDKIFLINAPVKGDGDFSKVAYLVNDMMETMIVK
ncbi:MAG: hypothetical protein RLZZ30_2036 [Bacteroidota bacterium]